MPARVLLGFPLLVGWLVTLFSSMMTAIVTFITQRGIINTLFVAASVAVLGVFVTFMDSQVSNALSQLASSDWGGLTYSILPTSTSSVVSIAMSVDAARWLYDQSQSMVDRKFN